MKGRFCLTFNFIYQVCFISKQDSNQCLINWILIALVSEALKLGTEKTTHWADVTCVVRTKHRLSKCQSLTTAMRRTSLTCMIKYKWSQVQVYLFKSNMLKFANFGLEGVPVKSVIWNAIFPVLKEIQYFVTLLFAHYLVNRYVEIMVLKDKLIRNFYHIVSLRSAHTRELVLATSRGNKSHRVNSPFLLESLVVRPKILSLRLVPRNKTGLNF